MARTFNPSPGKAEEGESLRVQAQPGLYGKLQASQDYTVRLCLKKKACKDPGVTLASYWALEVQ